MTAHASLLIALLTLLSCRREGRTDRGGGVAAAGGVVSGLANGDSSGGGVGDGRGVVPRLDAAEVAVAPGKSLLRVAWSLPAGTAINDDAPFAVRWTSSDGLVRPPNDILGLGAQVAGGFDVPIEVAPENGGAQLAGAIELVVCDVATHSVCVPLKRRLELTFAVSAGSVQSRVTLPLPAARP